MFLIVLSFYSTLSVSIYKNNKAIDKPGNTIPTIGTKIDGKYEAIIK